MFITIYSSKFVFALVVPSPSCSCLRFLLVLSGNRPRCFWIGEALDRFIFFSHAILSSINNSVQFLCKCGHSAQCPSRRFRIAPFRTSLYKYCMRSDDCVTNKHLRYNANKNNVRVYLPLLKQLR